MSEFDYKDFDYTDAAWESLYNAVDDTVFLEQDAELIYKSLKHKLRFITFGEYLKRYIYQSAGITIPFSDMGVGDYQAIIKSYFASNSTPASFEPTTSKLSALSKNWLTQQTVKRKVVFLLGFGFRMSVEDVNTFLTKALREPEINPKDPFEVICWYCYKNNYDFPKFEKLKSLYDRIPHTPDISEADNIEYTGSIRTTMFSIKDDHSLMRYLSMLKTRANMSRISVTAYIEFMKLYDRARELIADDYNRYESELHGHALNEYIEKLSNNDRLYDYEKLQRISKFRMEQRLFTRDDITESDIEHIICAAIPVDRHGNLTPNKASKLNEQFAGRRFSRQRIGEVLSRKSDVNRFDLITLNFFIYSQSLDEHPDPKKRYIAFLDSTNDILDKCFMGGLYVQNPYECFVLMCILSLDPLGTYADVWELSYEK